MIVQTGVGAEKKETENKKRYVLVWRHSDEYECRIQDVEINEYEYIVIPEGEMTGGQYRGVA